MNHTTRSIKKCKQSGMSNIDIARVRATALKEIERQQGYFLDKGFILASKIFLNILICYYWNEDVSKSEIQQLMKQVITLYRQYTETTEIDYRELADYIESVSGYKFDAEWMKEK